MQLRDLGFRGFGIDRRIARRIGLHGRRGRRGRAGLFIVFLVHIALVGVVHPRLLGIDQRSKRGRDVGRGRRRFGGRPRARAGIQRGRLHHVGIRLQRAANQLNDQQGDHDHDRRRARDDQPKLLAGAVGFIGIVRFGLGVLRAFALRDVSGAVFFKEEMPLFRILRAFNACAELLKPLLEAILHARDRGDGAVA